MVELAMDNYQIKTNQTGVWTVRYHDLLDKYISDSRLSLREIARRCHKKGLGIDHSYISKLKRNVMPPASDKVNEILANVLGADPDALLIAAYREKIPANIVEKLATGFNGENKSYIN